MTPCSPAQPAVANRASRAPAIASLCLAVAYLPWMTHVVSLPHAVGGIAAALSVVISALWLWTHCASLNRSSAPRVFADSWPLWLGLVWTRELFTDHHLINLVLFCGFSCSACLAAGQCLGPFFERLERTRASTVSVVSWTLAALFTAVFSVEPWMKLASFKTYWMDFGYMIHPIWNTAQGRLFEYTCLDGSHGSSMGDHFSPIFLAVAAIFRMLPHPYTLFLVQAACGAAGGVLLFVLARHVLRSEIQALLVQAAFYAYAPLQFAMISDFHSDPLAVPFFCMILLAFERRNLKLLLAGWILALLCKEHIGVALAPLLAVQAFRDKQWRWLLSALCVTGCAYSVLAWTVFIPHFNQGAEALSLEVLYPGGHQGLAGAVGYLVTHPASTIARLVNMHNVEQLVWLLSPLLFLPAVVFPEILSLSILLPKELYGVFVMHNHHQALMAPLLFWCLLEFLRRRAHRVRLLAAVLTACLFVGFVSGESPLSHRFWRVLHVWYVPTHHGTVLERAVRAVPTTASVSADSHIAIHLYNRRELHLFPLPLPHDSMDYIAVDKKYREGGVEIRYITWKGIGRPAVLSIFDSLRASGSYETIFDEDSVVVLRKRGFSR